MNQFKKGLINSNSFYCDPECQFKKLKKMEESKGSEMNLVPEAYRSALLALLALLVFDDFYPFWAFLPCWLKRNIKKNDQKDNFLTGALLEIFTSVRP